MTTKGEETSAANKRRAAAEKRRQRILASSSKRLNAVGGDTSSVLEVPKSASASSSSEKKEEGGHDESEDGVLVETPVVDTVDNSPNTTSSSEEEEEDVSSEKKKEQEESTPTGEDGGVKVMAAAEGEGSSGGGGSSTMSASSRRLQQMRRRRAQKQQKQKEEEERKESGDVVSSEEKDVITVDAAATIPSDSAVAVEAVEAVPIMEEKVEPKEEAASSKAAATNEEEEEESEKKKYMGVARIRRQKILEKRASQRKLEEKEGPTIATTKATDVVNSQKPTITSSVSKVPILLELITVFMIFMTGLSVGWQTQSDYYTTGKDILVFEHGVHGGDITTRPMILLPTWLGGEEKDVVDANPDLFIDTNKDKDDDNTESTEQEEFDDDTTQSSHKKPHRREDDPAEQIFDQLIIQPLLIVKYLLTSRANPLRYLFDIFFHVCPPIFFLAVLLLRRVGKWMGASLPEDESSQDSKSAIKTMNPMLLVKNFVAGLFPGMTSFLGLYMEARTDMYLIVCGWLVGVTLPVWLREGGYFQGDAIGDGEL